MAAERSEKQSSKASAGPKSARPRSRSKKRRHEHDATLETLDELESLGDRLAQWVADHPLPLLGGALAILLVAGIWGFASQHARAQREAASGALARVEREYRLAMGGEAAALEVPEPANPESGQRIREEFSQKFEAVAQEFSGLPVAALALLQAGALEARLDHGDRALELHTRALEELDPDSPARALALARLAALHEQANRWQQAADAYAQAARIERYPLRYAALAAAARAHAETGQDDEALALYRQIRDADQDARLEPPLAARLRELEAGREGRPAD